MNFFPFFSVKKDYYLQKWFVRKEVGIKTKTFSSPKTIKIFIENSEKIISLEGVSFEIWQLLKKPISFETLIKKLKKQYEVSEKNLKKDVIDFLSHLQKNNLIEVLDKVKS